MVVLGTNTGRKRYPYVSCMMSIGDESGLIGKFVTNLSDRTCLVFKGAQTALICVSDLQTPFGSEGCPEKLGPSNHALPYRTALYSYRHPKQTPQSEVTMLLDE